MDIIADASHEIKQLPCALAIKDLDDTGTFKGYASVFGALDLGMDIVEAGAFKRTLREHAQRKTMPKMLWQHDRHEPIGVWTALAEDDKGLAVEGRLILDVQRGRETHALLKAKAIDGLSIGYQTKKYKVDTDSQIRRLLDVDLLEISPVTFPMLPKATITAVKGLPRTVREFEEYLRDVGYSAAAAKRIASAGFKGADDRDDVGGDDAILQRMLKTIESTTNLLKGVQ